MKTILVPTDFSVTSRNAAIYACNFAKAVNAEKIILFNAYQSPAILTEATIPVMPVMDVETLEEISTKGLNEFKRHIQSELPDTIVVEDISAFGVAIDAIKEICTTTHIDLIVMGISGASKLEELIIGSTATSVLKHISVPVIIVPGQCSFKPINNIAFACDYKKVIDSIPLDTIKKVLEITGAHLHVLNIYHEIGSFDAELLYEEELAHSILKSFSPQFHVVENESFMDGINQFVDEHAIDLIISIPKKHGFFDSLFKESHTKQMAFHGHIPLLALHEKDK